MRIPILLILALTITCKITIKADFKDRSSLKRGTISYDLSNQFDFSAIKYPAVFTPTVGKVYTYQDAIHTTDIGGGQLQGIAGTKILDKNILGMLEAGAANIFLLQIQGSDGHDGKQDTISLNFDKREADFRCEDLLFEPKKRFLYVACRAPKDDAKQLVSRIAMFVYSFKNQDWTQTLKIETDENDAMTIKNRIKLKLYRDQFGEAIILMHDQKTENGVDADIDFKVRPFRILGDALTIEAPWAVNDPNGDVPLIKDFTVFKNQILALGKRKDAQGEELSFTLLNIDADESKLTVTTFKQVLDVPTKGYSMFSEKGNLLSHDPEQKLVLVQKVSDDFKSTPWILDLQSYSLEKVAPTGGVRDIQEGTNAVIAKFSTGLGLQDQDNTYFSSSTLDTAEKITAGCLINSVLAEFSLQKLAFKKLVAPFWNIIITDEDFNFGDNAVTVKAKDAEGAAPEVISHLKFTLIKDPYDTIEAQPLAITAEAYQKGVIYFPYKRSMITKGNSLSFGVQVSIPVSSGGKAYSTHAHGVYYSPSLPKNAKVEQYNVLTGAALFFNQKTQKLHWYQCDRLSDFETRCSEIGQTNTFTSGYQSTIGSVLEVVYATQYNEKDKYSFFMWYPFSDDWEYEKFSGRILDVGHMRSSKIDNRVYSVLAFEDHVKISVFFDHWYYGNRNTKSFYHDDVGGYEFCPTQVISDFNDRTSIYVLSVCSDEEELFKFQITQKDDEQVVLFIGSRVLGTGIKDPKVCILENEMIVYSQTQHQAYSVSKDPTLSRKVQIDLKDWNINSIQDFECNSEKNQFLILTRVTDFKEVVIFNGMGYNNDYLRVHTRLTQKNPLISRIQTYNHENDMIVVLINDSTGLNEYIRVYLEAPYVYAFFDDFKGSYVDQTVTLQISTPTKNNFVTLGTVTPIKPIDLSVTAVPEKKQVFKKQTKFSLKDSVAVQGPIIGISLVDESEHLSVYDNYKGTTFYNVGKERISAFKKLGAYDIFSDLSGSVAIHYGTITINKQGAPFSKYYSLDSFRDVDFVRKDVSVLAAMITNQEKGTNVEFTYALGGKFKGKEVRALTNSVFDSVKLYLKTSKPAQTNEYDDEYFAFLHSKKTGDIKVLKIAVNEDITEGTWDLLVEDLGLMGQRATSYGIVRTDKYFAINYSKIEVNQAYRVEFNQETVKFENESKQVLGTAEKQEFIEGVSCDINPHDDGKQACAWATYGSVIFYSEYTPTTFDKFKLLRYGAFGGAKLSIVDNTIILETDSFDSVLTAEKKLEVWDASLVKSQTTAGQTYIAVHHLIELTKDQKGSSKDSKLLQVLKNPEGNIELFMLVQDDTEKTGSIESKIVCDWTVQVVDTTFADVKDLQILFGQSKTGGTPIKIADLFKEV